MYHLLYIYIYIYIYYYYYYSPECIIIFFLCLATVYNIFLCFLLYLLLLLAISSSAPCYIFCSLLYIARLLAISSSAPCYIFLCSLLYIPSAPCYMFFCPLRYLLLLLDISSAAPCYILRLYLLHRSFALTLNRTALDPLPLSRQRGTSEPGILTSALDNCTSYCCCSLLLCSVHYSTSVLQKQNTKNQNNIIMTHSNVNIQMSISHERLIRFLFYQRY